MKETNGIKLARLEEQNKYQTTSIDEIKKMMKDHVKSSGTFRKQCSDNARDIKWMKRIALSAFGLVGIIYGLIKSKLGG